MLILKLNGGITTCAPQPPRSSQGICPLDGRPESLDYQITVRVPHSGMCKFCVFKLANTAKTERQGDSRLLYRQCFRRQQKHIPFIKSSVGKTNYPDISLERDTGFVSFELARGHGFYMRYAESFF